jgi:hypothetical protein
VRALSHSTTRRRARLLSALLLTLLVALAPALRAEDARVVLLEGDPRIADAVAVALSPWKLSVVPGPGPLPPPDAEAASASARAIASDQRAAVVLWIAPPPRPGEHGSLWVYDAQSQQLVVRPLIVSAPFDDASSAAVALSVKTILRATPLVTQLALGRSGDAPAHDATEPIAAIPAEPAAEPATLPPRRAGWRLETVAGARMPTGAPSPAEPWAGLGVSLWPAAQGGHLGAGIDAQGGTGVAIATSTFQGEFRQGSIAATARLRTSATHWLAFELRAGPALVVTSFDGQALSPSTPIHAVRANPALALGVVLDWTPQPHISLGATGNTSTLLRFQRYALDGAVILTEPTIALVAGVRLSVEVE